MQSTPTESRGLRLPQALWQRIDSEAEATGMSTNELLKRRLTVAFDFDSKVQKTLHGGEPIAD